MSSPSPQTDGHTLIAKCVKAFGISTVFGVVGIPVVPTGTAFQTEGLQFLSFRNEQSASYGASVAGYLSGKPGVMLSVAGPGVVHALAGVANAWSNCWPMLLISGSNKKDEDYKGAFQECRHLDTVQPFVKFSARVDDITRIPFFIHKAMHVAASGRPGPVYLEVSEDILEAKVSMDKLPSWVSRSDNAPVPGLLQFAKPAPSPSVVNSVLGLLNEAKCPLVVIGKGVAMSHAEVAMRRFIDRSHLPFLPTPMGKGVVPDDHPLSVATARSTALANADVVLLLGARLNWIMSFGQRFKPTAKIIRVDISGEELDEGVPLHLAIHADLGETLNALNQALDAKSRGQSESQAHSDPHARYESFWQQLRPVMEKNVASADRLLLDRRLPMSYHLAFAAIKTQLTKDTIIVNEGSNTMDIGRMMLPTYFARHRLDAGTFATMGLGLGYAIAAKVHEPKRPVVAVLGDSAFGFYATEIETAARYKLPIVVVVINNNGIYSGLDKLPESGPIPVTALTPGTSYEKLGEALGARGYLCHTPDEVSKAMYQAMRETSVPSVINVLIAPSPRQKPKVSAQHPTAAMSKL